MRWLAYCLALLLFQHAWAQDVVDVAEEEETIDLGVVVVEAGALPAPADEEPAPVETATPESEPTIVEQLRESSATTVISGEQLRDAASVADALERIPGADIRRSGGAGQLDTVLLRGARAQQVLVLVDGAPLMPGQVADLALLPAQRIARVEVIRGPEAARFGVGALGGVINIVTEADGSSNTTATTRTGGHSLYQLDLSGSQEKWDWHASQLSSQNDYRFERQASGAAIR